MLPYHTRHPYLEGHVQLDDVPVRHAAVQAYLPDELHLVQLAQRWQVVHLDSHKLTRLDVTCLYDAQRRVAQEGRHTLGVATSTPMLCSGTHAVFGAYYDALAWQSANLNRFKQVFPAALVTNGS